MDLKTSGILLRILNLVAFSDGSISKDEESLLEVLEDRYRLQNKLLNWENDLEDPNDIHQLAPLITSQEDRLLAAKLAYMVVSVSKNPGDTHDINAAEKSIYRELVEALGLSIDQLNLTEKIAKEEIDEQPHLWKVLYGAFGELGCWPDPSVMGRENWADF